MCHTLWMCFTFLNRQTIQNEQNDASIQKIIMCVVYKPFGSSHNELCLLSMDILIQDVIMRSILPFTQVIDCGGLIYFASTDLLTIESPSYPNPYPPNLHCSWSVHGTQGSTIKGTFISFQLHTSSASLAVYDRLSDDDDGTRILSATGFVIPPSFTASQAIKVVFTT